MAEIQLKLAPASSRKEGYQVLEEPIADDNLANIEVLHLILDGDSAVLVDGVIGLAYVHKAGSIIAALAVSREATATLEVDLNLGTKAAYPTVALLSASAPLAFSANQVAEAVLTTWTVAIPAMSILEAKVNYTTPLNAKLVDVYVVIQH